MEIMIIDGAEWACTPDGRPITIIQRCERIQPLDECAWCRRSR